MCAVELAYADGAGVEVVCEERHGLPLPEGHSGRGEYEIICGDAREVVRSLPQVHCVVTSPPYWGKRVYGDNSEEVGREADVEEYLVTLVGILADIPLHPRGSMWINLGDKRDRRSHGLMGIPHRFVTAMSDAGFVLADEVIWAKGVVGIDGNTAGGFMTEPAPGRLNGNGFEPLLRFVRSRRVSDAWSDTCAVSIPRQHVADVRYLPEELMSSHTSIEGRNAPNVWLVPMGQTREKHLAVYPLALIERCVAGYCPVWANPDGSLPERMVERVEYDEQRGTDRYTCRRPDPTVENETQMRERSQRNDLGRTYVARKPVTTGWSYFDPDGSPGLVLDPFCGTGTTGEAALRLGRSFIGIDLYQEYCGIARGRCEGTVRWLRAQGLQPLAVIR